MKIPVDLVLWLVYSFTLSKNKNSNHSINEAKKLEYDRWFIYKQLCGLHSRVIRKNVYGVAMFVRHKIGGGKVEETSAIEFCHWNEKLLL